MVINTNTSALNAATQLDRNSTNLSNSLARLSSGSQITSPSDDPAGLAVSMKLSAQVSRTNAAMDNVNNAISFNQTQDGYLQQVNTALSRMSELSINAQDITKTTTDRQLYQQEFSALGSYINTVATQSFNGVSLFNGATLSVTTDGDGGSYSNIGVKLGTGNTSYTNATGDNISSLSGAAGAVTDTKTAIQQLAHDRATLGANEESLGYYSAQLGSLSNNLQAATSRITDVDVATESTTYAKENILVQSSTAMLAQANSMPQSLLRLIS
jgi:flagellin